MSATDQVPRLCYIQKITRIGPSGLGPAFLVEMQGAVGCQNFFFDACISWDSELYNIIVLKSVTPSGGDGVDTWIFSTPVRCPFKMSGGRAVLMPDKKAV